MSTSPSGAQHVLTFADQRAVVTEVGATLREYRIAGVPYLDGFDQGARASDGRGQVLAPWPNRLADGRYVFAGQAVQAPLNEPSRGNAIHGLVRWLAWALVEQSAERLVLECQLRPQPGYEWALALRVEYALGPQGFRAGASVTNVGSGEAPLGVGFHPYVTIGRAVDEMVLTLPAQATLDATHPDSPPTVTPVRGTDLDFTAGRSVGAQRLDTAFGDVRRGAGGIAVATVTADGAPSVDVWFDQSFGYLMVYTGDLVSDLDRRRTAIAIEPMSCPPNALRHGLGLVALAPGETWQGNWGLTVRGYENQSALKGRGAGWGSAS
jgi:aldose 1-epimerase